MSSLKSRISLFVHITSRPSSSGMFPLMMSAWKSRTRLSGKGRRSIGKPLLFAKDEPNGKVVGDDITFDDNVVSSRYSLSFLSLRTLLAAPESKQKP